MHKRLETDLISLAHSILKMKNKEDVFALKEKSKEIYEKLSLLAFVEEYVNTTPNIKETSEDLIAKVKEGLNLKEEEGLKDKKQVNFVEDDKIITEESIITEQPFDELESIMFSTDKDANSTDKNEKEEELKGEREVIEEIIETKKNLTLEEELKDTISVDEIATLFDTPVSKPITASIQIDLNDRILFVKNLFEGNQEDYNRVISQLNTYTSEKEARKFIKKMVKPDYDWSGKEELEKRFVMLISRKFV